MHITPENTMYLFKGGNIELVIKLIIANTVLLFVSDFAHFIGFIRPEMPYTLSMLFRLAAMCAIAFGGLRLIER